MGLDCSHDAWKGSHNAFLTWRRKLAEVAGLPPLDLMEGFYTSLAPYNFGSIPTLSSIADKETANRLRVLEPGLPIQWECLKPDALHELLYQNYRGQLAPERCLAVASRLEELLPKLPTTEAPVHIRNWREKTQIFIDGLRRAAQAGETLRFL